MRTRLLLASAALLVATTGSACSPVIGDESGSATDSTTAVGGPGGEVTTIPAPADVRALADPRSFEGPVDLALPETSVEPVSTAPRQTLPATVTDVQGRRVTVTDTRRILALDIYGTLSRTVFELGLGDEVVGRDLSSAFPEIADRPLVTRDGHQLDAEAILALDPSVVLTDTSLGPYDVILQLEDAGVPVVVVDSHRGLDNLSSLTQQVAAALGVPREGRTLGARIEQRADEAGAQAAALAPDDVSAQLRTVFLYARGQAGVYYLFGEGSGADTLITAAGGYDVAGEIGWTGMKPVNDEALVSAQPDAIVMMTKGLSSVGGVDGLLERFPALAQTPAGEHRRVISMPDDQVLSFGPRTGDVVSALAVALYAPQSLAGSAS